MSFWSGLDRRAGLGVDLGKQSCDPADASLNAEIEMTSLVNGHVQWLVWCLWSLAMREDQCAPPPPPPPPTHTATEHRNPHCRRTASASANRICTAMDRLIPHRLCRGIQGACLLKPMERLAPISNSRFKQRSTHPGPCEGKCSNAWDPWPLRSRRFSA